MVRLLLENGADPSTRESPRRIGNPGRGWTPLTLAIGRENSYEAIQLLLQYGADAEADSESTLCAVARTGKSDDFLLLVQSGADIKIFRRRDWLMRLACRSNYEPIIRLLVQRGVNPKPRPRICRGPLQRRIQPGSIETLERKIWPELMEAKFAKLYGSDT